MAKTGTAISVNPATVTGLFSEIGILLQSVLVDFFGDKPIDPEMFKLTMPPDAKMGDFAFGCFQPAKALGLSPAEFSKKLEQAIKAKLAAGQGNWQQIVADANSAGPYLNLTLNRKTVSEKILKQITEGAAQYGTNNFFQGKTIMVEYLSPNTNKPLHIGHLRNGVVGTTVASLLKASGANVIRANNINDRGIHIVQSMLAYLLWGNGETPESTGEKGDHFVGRYYVKFHQEVARLYKEWLEAKRISLEGRADQEKDEIKKEFQGQCEFVQRAYQMLRQWEAGDPEIISLWKKMNQWVYQGFGQTNERLGFGFEKVYYESNTYKLGRDIILQQLEKGIGQRNKDGSVVISLSDVKLGDNPISLIRSDGTSLYVTQDIGLAATRFKEIPGLDSIIYVVGREQEFHFKVLFEILKRYGYAWHSNLYHLSYGMVNIPSGRMKSREGTVVDADEFVDNLRAIAAEVIKNGKADSQPSDTEKQAEAIAIGALKYMFVSVSPNRDIMFDPQKSVSFEGSTGPYLQYACVRIAAIEEKVRALPLETLSPDRAVNEREFDVAKKLAIFPEAVLNAAVSHDPSILTSYLFEAAKSFSAFYTDCPVIYDGKVDPYRLALCKSTKQVLQNGLTLLGIPVPDRM